MANQKITDLTEKVTLVADDLVEIIDSEEPITSKKNKKVKLSTLKKDGSGTTIRDSNKVDLGGVLSAIATIRKNNTIAFQILKKATGDDGEFQQFIMANSEFFLQYRATAVDLSVQIGMEKSGSGVQAGGGLYMNVSPIDQSAQAGINFGKTGIIIFGDIFGSGRASHVQYDTDYSNKIDALDPAVKDLVLPHIKWINNNGNANININNAGVLALNTTPQAVKAAGGANIILIPQQVTIRHNFVTAAFATNTTLQIGVGSVYVDLTTTVMTSGSTQIDVEDITGLFTNISANQPINVKVKTGDPTAGGGTLDIWIVYKTLDIS